MTPFFPYSGLLASILLPSRGCYESLVTSISSLINNAYDRSCFEIIVKVDDDDLKTAQVLASLQKQCPETLIRAAVSPRGRGYPDLGKFVNEMAAEARGDWLILWDNDFIMRTKYWDRRIYNTVAYPAYPWSTELALLTSKENNVLVCIRKFTYKLLGHIALSAIADRWIHDISQTMQLTSRTNIKIEHDHKFVLGDEQLKTEAYHEQCCNKSEEMLQRAKDTSVIANKMVQLNADAEWTMVPTKAHAWYIWKGPKTFPQAVWIDGRHTTQYRMAAEYVDPPIVLGNGAILDHKGKLLEPDYPSWCYLHD